MRKTLLLLTTVLLSSGIYAQIEHGGEPLSWQTKSLNSNVNKVQMDPIDLELAKSQDAVTDQYKETIYRFGIEHEVDIDFFAEATVTQIKGNQYLWRLAIECPEALSVNFLADDFYIPEGGKMFVLSADSKKKKGAFTSENNRENRIFPVGLLPGSEIVIEYQGVLGSNAALHISQITHGYRPILGMKGLSKGPFGSSGACNINVNCPEGLPYDEQKRAVAIIVQGGGVCTGSLVNNALQDESPYFLTANHCLGNPNNWNYYFNHESAACVGSTGPTTNSISGGQLLASNSGSDFALIELNSNVPASFNPCFAGYDASTNLSPTSAVGIHHPGGDVKKICFENNAPFEQTLSFNGNPNTDMWYINQWEDGVTEPGSSGSPLYDNNGRVIAVLSGGAAACSGTGNNGQYDFYGRVNSSWDGTNASNRLRDHLDPNDSNILITEMFCPYDVEYAIDAASQGLLNVPDILCGDTPFTPSFVLRNQGTTTLVSATIEYAYNGVDQTPIEWTGSLEQTETDEIPLGLFTPGGGANTITVTITNPNGTADGNEANNGVSESIMSVVGETGVGSFEIEILTDDWAEETSWDVKNSGGLIIDSGTGYVDNTTYDFSVPIPAVDCYTFTIYDTEGDGICCGFGEGSYSVEDANGTVLMSGGEFGSEESGTFSMEMSVGLTDKYATEFSVFPNPTEDMISVKLSKDLGPFQIDVINTIGQTVLRKSYNGAQLVQLDLSSLSSGSYTLHLRNETESGVQRITVK